MNKSLVDPPPPDSRDRCWLEFPRNDLRPKIRSTSKSWRRDKAEGSICIENLTSREVEAVEAFLKGLSYVRVVNGRLHAYETTDLPEPEDDPIFVPHWKPTGLRNLFDGKASESGWKSPGIVISHVGAGHEPREPQRSYKILTECGFVCLRSKREGSGYWEQWVLHSLRVAEGLLKERLDKFRKQDPKPNWKEEVTFATDFIARDLGVSFGTMDVTIQRWALCVPD